MANLKSTTVCNVATVTVAKPYVVCDMGAILVTVSVPGVGEVAAYVSHGSGLQGWSLSFEGAAHSGDHCLPSSEIEAIIYRNAKELAKMIEADSELTQHRIDASEYFCSQG